ncbi:MAG: phosphate ABC transporter substrate-binding protein [Desulfobacterales bacterium]
MAGNINQRRSLIAVMVLLLFVFSVSVVRAGSLDLFTGEKGEIKISGGTAHIPVMKDAAKLIMEHNRDIRISIAGGGSGVGIKQVGEGLVDIGNSGRKPTDDEVKKYGLNLFQWATDGVGVVVNPQNPVKALSKSQLLEIFAGKIVNWKVLGGPDKPITVYTRDNASGTREVFWEKALDKGEVTDKANVVVSNGAMKTAVANDPHGIGYVSVGHMDNSTAPVIVDGVAPSIDNVKNGSYKIARGLFSNTKGEPKGLVKKFVDFLFSQEGQDLVVKNGFITIK